MDRLITGSAVVDDGEQQQPQDERLAPLPDDEAAIFAFMPGARESPLPRWLAVSLPWLLGLAAVAAAAGAGLLVMRERQTDQTLAMVAAHAIPSTMPSPDQAGEARPAGARLLQHASASGARGTEPAVRLQPGAADTNPPRAMTARPVDAGAKAATTKPRAGAARTKTARAKTKLVASGAKAAPLKARPGKAKSGVKKSGSAKKSPAEAPRAIANANAAAKVKVTAKAKAKTKAYAKTKTKTKTYTWPRRNDSVAERLNAARRACRARRHTPGECNLRACDVLGSAHSACR